MKFYLNQYCNEAWALRWRIIKFTDAASLETPTLLPCGPLPHSLSNFSLLRQLDWEFLSLVWLLIVHQGTKARLSFLGVSFLYPHPHFSSIYSSKGSKIASSVRIPDSLNSLKKKEGKQWRVWVSSVETGFLSNYRIKERKRWGLWFSFFYGENHNFISVEIHKWRYIKRKSHQFADKNETYCAWKLVCKRPVFRDMYGTWKGQ